jgi:hypothetical protein
MKAKLSLLFIVAILLTSCISKTDTQEFAIVTEAPIATQSPVEMPTQSLFVCVPPSIPTNNANTSNGYKSGEGNKETNTIENSWFYYFSSLAQTIAAGSALLVALVVIRLQNLSTLLNSIEHAIAEAFYNINEQDEYRNQAFAYFLEERWGAYFDNVKRVAEDNQHKFEENHYIQSKAFLDSLIEKGRKLEERNSQLRRTLSYSFAGMVMFTGVAILVIPIAQWISPQTLWGAWGASGILLIVLFFVYYRQVVSIILKPKG